MTLAFLNIGTQEMILIVIVILLLFGGKKLPELARGLGKGIREFKDASEDIKREISDQINNFEKDLDVTVEDKKSVTPTSVEQQPTSGVAEGEVAEELAASDDAPVEEKKFPQFTQPEHSVQHDPGAHPVDETEYYKYGYNDYFSEEENSEVKESNSEDKPLETPKENPSQNA